MSKADKETLRKSWDSWATDDWDDYTNKELALAFELARLFQSPDPTIEQVSYFVEDASSIASDVSDGPWVVRKSFLPNARFMWLVLIDDVLCGLEDEEGSELTSLGKLPIEWESASAHPVGVDTDEG